MNEEVVPLVMNIPVTVIVGIFIAILVTLTVVGNALVLFVFIKDNTVRTFSDCLILNLAISDLMIGLLAVTIYTPFLLMGRWIFGHPFCLIWLIIDYVTPAASALNICTISLDRYLQIGHPFWARTHRTRGFLVLLIIIPWALPSMYFVPAIALWEIGQGRSIPDNDCFLPYKRDIGVMLGGTSIECIGPFIIVAYLNLLVYFNIRQRRKRFEKPTNTGAWNIQNDSTTGISKQTQRNVRTSRKGDGPDREKLKFKRDQKAVRSLFILVFVFGVCWLPYEITAIVHTLCGDCVNAVWFEVSFWLLWINSTINPYLYPFLHIRYKNAIIRLFNCRSNSIAPTTHAETVVTT